MTITKLLPLVCERPRIVKINHNVLELSHSLKKESLNLLIAIECALQHAMTSQSEGLERERHNEIKLEIPREFVTLRHATSIPDSVYELMNLAVFTQRNIPGCKISCTRIISGVSYSVGHFFITVPGEAVPFLLYCGQGVNYFLIEKPVFFKIKKLPHKLLYLFIVSRINKASPRSYIDIFVEDLYLRMGICSAIPLSSLVQKYLQTFPEVLKESGSHYIVEFHLMRKRGYTGRTGRKPIEKVQFVVQNKEREAGDDDLLAATVDQFVKLLSKYSPQKKVTLTSLIEKVEQTGKAGEFLDKMTRIGRKAERDKNWVKFTNTAAMILREDFDIII